MNLKDSFRYQKFLETMITDCNRNLSSDLAVTTTEFHENPLNNETKVIEKTQKINSYNYTIKNLVDFMQYLAEQKRKLTETIEMAKANSNVQINALIETAKAKRKVANTLKRILSFKTEEIETEARGYAFNEEGNQISFYYPVTIKRVENYNRKEIIALYHQMLAEADECSNKVDMALVNIEVPYNCDINVNSSFEDAIDAFKLMQE